MYEKTYPSKRFNITLQFLKKHITTSETIFDLGVSNPFSKIMEENGYTVKNTKGEDLDNDQSALQNETYQVFTAFEIFEHLLNPYTVLENVKCNKLLISIPLRLWFSSAYRSKTDTWDRHYHEFEDWQLDWLLEKTGFKIIDSIKFTHPVKKFGFRPLLRYFTPRYYIIYAERVK
jgi:hypothetical protein